MLSIADFEALSGASTDTDSLDQVKRILTVFAGDEQAKQLEREPMQVAFNLIQDYGETLAKSQGVELGKIADFCRILNSDDGVKVRADFARFGWSIEHDLGRRLPYRDAIDLYTALCGDPSSYTGASLIGLMFPMSATDITVLQFLGASTLLGDVDGEPETDEPTAEEIHEAETHMSKLFG